MTTPDTEPSTGERTGNHLRTVLVVGSVIALIGLGVRSTFGLFLNDISDALDSETSVFALAIAIQNLLWGIGQPIAGAIADRYGTGRVLATGAVIYAGGVLLMANVQSEAQLYLSAGFLLGVGLAATSFAVVLAAIGRMYPPEKRAKALGIVTAIGSAGQLVFVLLTNAVESLSGWRTALVVLGVVAATIVVLARPLRGNAADAQAASSAATGEEGDETLRDALRRAGTNRSYLLLNAGFFVCGFHVTFIAAHLIAHFENEGIGSGVAGLSWGLVGLFNIAGSYLAGVLGTRHQKTRLLSAIYALRGLVMTAFVLLPTSTVTAVGFGVGMGMLWLATVPLTGAIVAQQFGTRHSGTLFGIVFFTHQIGAFVGVWGGGQVADAAGDYTVMWWIAVALAGLATALHFFIDEGPQPLAPARTPRRARSRVLRPAAGLGVLALVAAMAITPALATGDEAEARPSYCVLHPAAMSRSSG